VGNIGHVASCLQVTESVKQADANASVAGKGIGASAHQHQPSIVSIPRGRCAVEEAHVCVADVNALIPGASGVSVNTAPPVTQAAVKTGMALLSPEHIKQFFILSFCTLIVAR
jgi:hypothetical protein